MEILKLTVLYTNLSLPILTPYHTLENSKGTLDPLGLYTISDRLASRLAPGLRERMKHPRYLTAMAVSALVCSPFAEDELARDGITPPWQVFEWYLVTALVKRFEKADPKQLLGMPGREKTTRALRENVPLNASRYLKTPSVFGFHGVYRTLAKNMNLVDDMQPGEFSIRLIDIWEKEQSLTGFSVGAKGTRGCNVRNKLYEAVYKGLEAAAVAKSPGWDVYQILADSLAPKSLGKEESSLLLHELKNGSSAVRAELIDALASKEGQESVAQVSEKNFHSWLLEKSMGNSQLIKTIQSYERACRLLYNAFYGILLNLKKTQSKGKLDEFVNLIYIKQVCDQLPDAFIELEELLDPFPEEAALFRDGLKGLGQPLNPKDWIRIMFEHHIRIQRNKPPYGKAPWILEHGAGAYLLNTTQFLDVDLSDEYVHQYRTFSLQSFLKDLGRIG